MNNFALHLSFRHDFEVSINFWDFSDTVWLAAQASSQLVKMCFVFSRCRDDISEENIYKYLFICCLEGLLTY